jgi:hypothetical protein
MTGELYRKVAWPVGLRQRPRVGINLRTAERHASGESVTTPYIAKVALFWGDDLGLRICNHGVRNGSAK